MRPGRGRARQAPCRALQPPRQRSQGHAGRDRGPGGRARRPRVVTVQDDGPGIDAGRRRRSSSRSPRAGPRERGAGLGLTIARQLALLMGGDLEVASRRARAGCSRSAAARRRRLARGRAATRRMIGLAAAALSAVLYAAAVPPWSIDVLAPWFSSRCCWRSAAGARGGTRSRVGFGLAFAVATAWWLPAMVEHSSPCRPSRRARLHGDLPVLCRAAVRPLRRRRRAPLGAGAASPTSAFRALGDRRADARRRLHGLPGSSSARPPPARRPDPGRRPDGRLRALVPVRADGARRGRGAPAVRPRRPPSGFTALPRRRSSGPVSPTTESGGSPTSPRRRGPCRWRSSRRTGAGRQPSRLRRTETLWHTSV